MLGHNVKYSNIDDQNNESEHQQTHYKYSSNSYYSPMNNINNSNSNEFYVYGTEDVLSMAMEIELTNVYKQHSDITLDFVEAKKQQENKAVYFDESQPLMDNQFTANMHISWN
eukprot:161448_1